MKYMKMSSMRRRTGLSPERERRVISFVEANVGEPIDVEDMAAAANLSRYHFCRAFKVTTGLTPTRFLMARRIERAKKMLRDGRPIADVAHECAFSSQSHFTSTFKREVGMTPGRFRAGLFGALVLAALRWLHPVAEAASMA